MQKKKWFHLMQLFLLSCVLLSADSLSILFVSDLPENFPPPHHAIWNYHGKIIHIRGFWYPSAHPSMGILAPQPNLKSCCIGTAANAFQQVFVNDSLIHLSPGRAITLSGVFKIAPIYAPEGKIIQLYVLDQASEVPAKSFVLSVCLGGLLLMLLMILLLRKKSLKN